MLNSQKITVNNIKAFIKVFLSVCCFAGNDSNCLFLSLLHLLHNFLTIFIRIILYVYFMFLSQSILTQQALYCVTNDQKHDNKGKVCAFGGENAGSFNNFSPKVQRHLHKNCTSFISTFSPCFVWFVGESYPILNLYDYVLLHFTSFHDEVHYFLILNSFFCCFYYYYFVHLMIFTVFVCVYEKYIDLLSLWRYF